MNSIQLYSEYKGRMQKIADVRYALAVLQWDQETYMPSKSNEARARQVATLSEISHQLFTDDGLKTLLHELDKINDLQEDEKKNISLSLYDYEQQTKIPGEFVRKLSEVTSRSFQSWVEARKAGDFKIFEPFLAEMVDLKKQEANYLGYEGHIYNALLNQYERGATVEMLDRVFQSIQEPLKNLLDKISKKPPVDDGVLLQYFPRDQQWKFSMDLLKKMGFDFDSGRQDISEHPFTTSFSSSDVRITTRIDENDFGNMTWSCIHELGHGLYEQGLPPSEYGLPLGEFASLSIHESQSRLWENNVGRSFACWQYLFPILQQSFTKQFSNTTIEDFYRAINKVQPSLIRTEADELTYHFHVIIRYELEKKLMEGTIKVKDIPAYWNEQYKKYLGLDVPGDKQGCLQDVHWSHGSFGYFPTYSLGSLYAAQFFAKAANQVPELNVDIQNGRFQTLLSWLREHIHQYGRKYMSEELCVKLTGEPLNIEYFMKYATEKYSQIYSL